MTRSNSFPHLASTPSNFQSLSPSTSSARVTPRDSGVGVAKSQSAIRAVLGACPTGRSSISFRQDLRRPPLRVRSYTYAGPFCVSSDGSSDDWELPKRSIRPVPSLPVASTDLAAVYIPGTSRLKVGSKIQEADEFEDSSMKFVPVSPTSSPAEPLMPRCRSGSKSPAACVGITETSFDGSEAILATSDLDMSESSVHIDSPATERQGSARFKKATSTIIRNMAAAKMSGQFSEEPSNWSIYRPSLTSSSEVRKVKPPRPTANDYLNNLQPMCNRLVTSHFFEYLVLLLVIGSSISLVSHSHKWHRLYSASFCDYCLVTL